MSLPGYLVIKRNNNFKLDSYDYQVLFMLYKILIGPKAIDLYNTLYSISVDSFEKKINMLFMKDAISDYNLNDDELEELFGFLTTLKLISIKKEVFLENNRFVWTIELYPPYNGRDFFYLFDMSFSKQLKYRSSKFQFVSLMRKFLNEEIEVPDLKDDKERKLSSITKIIKPNKRKENMIPFSFGEFKEALKEFAVIKDEDKEFFTSVSNLYGYSLTEMMSLFYPCEENGVYDKDKFIRVAYNKFNESKPEIIKTTDQASLDHVKYFENAKLENVLIAKNVKKLSDADKNTLKRMREELLLPENFISLLITYSISTNNYKIHPFAYYKKICEDWESKNINTIEDAYFYICTLYSREFKKEKPKISNAEWVDNYWNNFEENDKDSANKKWIDDYWNNFDENKESTSKKFVDNYWEKEGEN